MTVNKISLQKEFREVVYESCKALGLDDFPARLLSVLQSESKEVSLGELSEMTGYSLSGLSTTLKALEQRGLVKRFKKPKSRKVYISMDKDITTYFIMLQKNRLLNSIKNSIEKIPAIIEKYNEMEDSKETELLKDYYQQVLMIEEESKKYIQALEERREELRRKKELIEV
jgi:DNA-binding transcriptional regulator GbsR (MarR family)